MRVCIHRGSNQIGGSCVELEQDGQRILLDLGLPLDAEENSSDYFPKTLTGLDGNDPNLLGILISHPHLDHYGLLDHVDARIPIGMGFAGHQILTKAMPFLPIKRKMFALNWTFSSKEPIQIGAFRVTPFLVDHSAYDAYAFLIEAGGKRLFYSGDFRAHGKKDKLFDALLANPPKDIDVLLMEGSSLGRIDDDARFPSESDIENELVSVFRQTEGFALVHTSMQNIDRIVSIFRASKRTGRKLVIDLYAAEVLKATGNTSIPQSDWDNVLLYVPQGQRVSIKEKQQFDLLKHHSKNRIYMESLCETPNKFTFLFRPMHRYDFDYHHCKTGASYIYSQWDGYWDAGNYDYVKTWLETNHIPKYNIHTSGHASPADLKTFALGMKPKKIIPIHSFMPEHYTHLFPNVEQHTDGEWWEI